MEHLNILKRAGRILWQYKVLWIFGILLALTTMSSNGGQNFYQFGSDRNVSREYNFDSQEKWGDFQTEDWKRLWYEMQRDFQREFDLEAAAQWLSIIIAIGIALVIVGLLLFILSRIVRYVAEVALIRMVSEYEDTGEKLRFREGWRRGWSRAAWRSFWVNLVIMIPIGLLFIVLLLIGLSPLLLWANGRTLAGVLGTISSIGMSFLFIFFGVIVLAVVRLLMNFFFRACALDNAGVGNSIKQGYAMVRHNLKDVGLMWLITIGLNILWYVVTIPVALLFFGLSVMLGGGFALVIRLISGIFLREAVAWTLGGVVGVPIFFIVFIVPLLLVEGFRLIYISSVWTLSYRELKALASLKPADDIREVDSEISDEIAEI